MNNKTTREQWLIQISNAALKAGNEILSIYNAGFTISTKTDQSPVTEADLSANSIITEALKPIGLPILSEEGEKADYEKRSKWSKFWMVDPLDGTKEFINRNGEFTVNIALIENGKPTMGVIYIPVTKTLYFADKKAFKIDNFNQPLMLEKLYLQAQELPLSTTRLNYTILSSRSYLNETTKNYIKQKEKQLGKVDVIQKGSSLKLCLIAEGSADIYPRFAPTMEWDIAAGHAIINASGGTVKDWETKKPLSYNKENLKNPFFLVER